MIYQIEIGAYDNCYIITGGLTGLTSFKPVIVNGDSDACSIIIDKKDDSIFSPWIKQSLKVSLVKENETDYAEIIAGDDNETYGILVENGELVLADSDLLITGDGVLKFIGTLAIESYSEQYKAISIVSFTFNDGIGKLADDEKIFKPLADRLTIPMILSDMLPNMIIYKKLYIEWLYTAGLTGTEVLYVNNPKDFYLNKIMSFYGWKKLDVLSQFLHDFGLKLIIDFEANAMAKLIDRGLIRIMSVQKQAEQINSYYCFTYENGLYIYNAIINETKIRNLLNTINIPLINNETNIELDRVASDIIAKTTFIHSENICESGVVSDKYFDKDINGDDIYNPFASISGTDVLTPLKAHMDNKDIFKDLERSTAGRISGEPCVLIPKTTGTTYNVLVLPSIMYKRDYSWWRFTFTIKAKRVGNATETLKAHLSFLWKEGPFYQINNSSNKFTDQAQLISDSVGQNIDDDTTFTINLGLGTAYNLGITPVLVCTCDENASVAITSVDIKIQIAPYGIVDNTIKNYLSSETLDTELSGNNRKKIALENKFCTCPYDWYTYPLDIQKYSNIINIRYEGSPVSLLTHDGGNEYKSLIAHISDQYGVQYDSNRWNVNGTCKIVNGSINLMGQFGLEDKVLTLISGEYNAKRKMLNAKWGQVLEVGTNKYRLLQDNFIPFTWDDGNYIMLN